LCKIYGLICRTADKILKIGGLSKEKQLLIIEIQYIEKAVFCLADTNIWIYMAIRLSKHRLFANRRPIIYTTMQQFSLVTS
ncbi:MAG: hypothetical protein J6V33_06365, partial [Bacteroidales bacterium]|nr:hypothetical protein [Bacteroidales bacterium]